MKLKTYSLNDDIIFKEVSNEVFLVNIKTGKYYTFNNTGSFILKLINENKSSGDIILAGIENFDIEKKIFNKDFITFINILIEKSLLPI